MLLLLSIRTTLPSIIVLVLLHESGQEFNGQRKDDSRVFLTGDSIERLEVAKLQRAGGLGHDIGCLFKRASGPLFPLCRYHL